MTLRSTLILSAAIVAFSGCNSRGNDDAGADSGGDCTPSGAENTGAACSDNVDNDCDGHTDCNDFDCCDHVSCGVDTACGRRDGGTPPGVACEGPSVPENTPDLCSDGCSNDHATDLFADCNDFDCCAHRTDCPLDTACGRNGPPPNACPGDPVPEFTLPRCMDGCSNDHSNLSEPNLHADCNDRNCCWIRHTAAERGEAPPCGSQTWCETEWFGPPSGAVLCPDLNASPTRENSYEFCSDGCDNNRNNFQDCNEFGCCAAIAAAVAAGVEGAVACAAGTKCADEWTLRDPLCDGDDGTGPAREETLEQCSNDCDDDRDGYADCDEGDCCGLLTGCPSDTFCGGMQPAP